MFYKNCGEQHSILSPTMPHAGIEPATFCLLDRRSAPEPMRRYLLALKAQSITLLIIQITMGIFGENWRLYVMKCLMELFDFSMYEEFQTSRDIFRKDQQMNVLT
uniref:Uncharacterized protein n=1 Tax=Onchocerca volvulus TaxID=6282 RepID=A0A8R1Y402_ONCVO